jgi:hypothetical protein
MKNKLHTLKGFIAGIIVAALAGGAGLAAPSIAPSTHKVTVDGASVDISGYNIEGSNYFKLRDIAAAVDFGVWYDESESAVRVETDRGYDAEYTGAAGESDALNGDGNEKLTESLDKGGYIIQPIPEPTPTLGPYDVTGMDTQEITVTIGDSQLEGILYDGNAYVTVSEIMFILFGAYNDPYTTYAYVNYEHTTNSLTFMRRSKETQEEIEVYSIDFDLVPKEIAISESLRIYLGVDFVVHTIMPLYES